MLLCLRSSSLWGKVWQILFDLDCCNAEIWTICTQWYSLQNYDWSINYYDGLPINSLIQILWFQFIYSIQTALIQQYWKFSINFRQTHTSNMWIWNILLWNYSFIDRFLSIGCWPKWTHWNSFYKLSCSIFYWFFLLFAGMTQLEVLSDILQWRTDW